MPIATVTDFSSEASIGVVKRIPRGYLRMGSRFDPREYPPKTIYVKEYGIAQAPVTVIQYASFLNSKAYRDQRWWGEAGWRWLQDEEEGWGRENRARPSSWELQRKRPYHPVVGVTWFEACAYCAWVAHEKKRVVRLPTEEEWEFAARGEDDERPFPWGEDFDPTYANTYEGGIHDTVRVASMKTDSSPFGVMDMCGNVQEWTRSSYHPIQDEIFPVGDLFVVRGGSFNDLAYGARVSYRRANPPGYFYRFLGFRIVVEN